MSYIREKTIKGLCVGDTFSLSRTFNEDDVKHFADISRDYNPIHFSEAFAKTKNYNSRICHGLLVGGMITEIGGQIGCLATEMNFSFKKPVYFGDTIECVFKITEIDNRRKAKAEAIFKNQNNDIVLEAFITGFLPGTQEKEIMNSMLDEEKSHQ